MGLLEYDHSQKYLELIEQFRLIDDTFFDVCLDGSTECMQLLLRIFFNRNDIIVRISSALTRHKCTIKNWLNEPTFSNIKKRGLIPCAR